MGRTTRRTGGSAGEPQRAAGRAGRPGKVKVTMWLDDELARKLRALRGWEGRELGEIAGPLIEAGLSPWYIAQRGARPAPASGPSLAIQRPDEPAGGAGPGESAA